MVKELSGRGFISKKSLVFHFLIQRPNGKR